MKGNLGSYLITVAVILIVSVGLFVYLYTTMDAEGRGDVRIEALKILMQLAAIGVIGGFVTWMLNERSKEKEREVASEQKRAERHEARNDFRRSAVARVVTATNVVRKAPILIESHRSKKTYGEQVRSILDAKLELSLLRHELDSSDVFTETRKIRDKIQQMEKYLNGIIDEWKERYQDLPVTPRDAWAEIRTLPALADLRKGDESSQFYREYLDGHRDVLRFMRADILSPLK